jgi:ATP-dependent Clp protease ATP-binding subunit ClpX
MASLEAILKSVSSLPEFRQSYSVNGKFSYAYPYLLPADLAKDGLVGHFVLGANDRIAVPLGLLQLRAIGAPLHYQVDIQANPFLNPPQEKALYLPLLPTGITTDLGSNTTGKDGKALFTPHDGSPFPVYGIPGADGLHPLVLLLNTPERLEVKGIYRTKNGRIATYDVDVSAAGCRDLLKKYAQDVRQGVRPGTAPAAPKAASAVANAFATKARKKESTIDWNEPQAIVAHLDKYVVGQAEAKQMVAVAFSNYIAKMRAQDDDLPKDNLILVGPSGVGKTYMISLLASEARIPIARTTLTGKSTEGYKGENLSTIFDQLRRQTKDKEPYGIVFLDEIDKTARDDWGSGSGFGSRLQDELIGWMSDTYVTGDNSEKKDIAIGTRNLLFVTAGAFQDAGGESLADIIARRKGGDEPRKMGFRSPDPVVIDRKVLLPKLQPDDLVAYGLKTELVGRLPALAVFRPLTLEDKVSILTSTEGSVLKKYAHLLKAKGYTVTIAPGTAEVIAQAAPDETGARALNSICSNIFTKLAFEPAKYAGKDKKLELTPELASELITIFKK